MKKSHGWMYLALYAAYVAGTIALGGTQAQAPGAEVANPAVSSPHQIAGPK